jgi:hypothetical protein
MNDRIDRQKDKDAQAQFDRAMRALVRVPKSEVDEEERKEREATEQRKQKARA